MEHYERMHTLLLQNLICWQGFRSQSSLNLSGKAVPECSTSIVKTDCAFLPQTTA